MHGIYEYQAFLDSTLLECVTHVRGDVNEGSSPGYIKPQFFTITFHELVNTLPVQFVLNNFRFLSDSAMVARFPKTTSIFPSCGKPTDTRERTCQLCLEKKRPLLAQWPNRGESNMLGCWDRLTGPFQFRDNQELCPYQQPLPQNLTKAGGKNP